MNRALAFALLTLSNVTLAMGQCAIRPIKPIPPIGCKDVTPECISDGNGKSHWNWICVPENAGTDTSDNPAWKPRQTEPAPPSTANATPPQAVPSTSANAHSQESAAAQEPTGVPIGEMNASEQQAAEQLRAITEAIKSCPHDVYRMPASIEAMEASDGMIETFGPPTNVIWNAEPNPSGRTHFLGSVEYVFPRSEMPPVDFCKRWRMKKKYCSEELHLLSEDYDRQEAHPWQFRYEFDITSHGPEFVRSFGKTKQQENEPWLPGGAEVCGKRAISLVLGNATQTSTPPSAPSAPALPLAATQASLSIESSPSGADIEIDGAFVGNTPSTVNVGPGSHQVAVKKKGFADWTKALNVTGGTVHLNAELKQEPAKQ